MICLKHNERVKTAFENIKWSIMKNFTAYPELHFRNFHTFREQAEKCRVSYKTNNRVKITGAKNFGEMLDAMCYLKERFGFIGMKSIISRVYVTIIPPMREKRLKLRTVYNKLKALSVKCELKEGTLLAKVSEKCLVRATKYGVVHIAQSDGFSDIQLATQNIVKIVQR